MEFCSFFSYEVVQLSEATVNLTNLFAGWLPSETKLDTPCQDMQDLDSLDKTWVILPRS